MKILIIGGTGFLGRHVTATALEKGMDVTLFNRGQRDSELFSSYKQVKTIYGDRKKDLEKLADLSFDVVIDTCGYFPSEIKKMLNTLGDKLKHYVFISTVSVYDLPRIKSEYIKEDSQVIEMDFQNEPDKIAGENYGALKYLCEKELEKSCVASCILRPGFIVGPDDHTFRFPYWIARVAQGGEVLVPTDKEAPTQFIDVRDLAQFVITCVEKKLEGIYNVVGPSKAALNVESWLESIKEVLKSNCSFHYMPEDKYFNHSDFFLTDIPFVFYKDSYVCARVETTKSFEAGLTWRDPRITIQDTWQWIKEQSREFPFGFLPKDREIKILENRE